MNAKNVKTHNSVDESLEVFSPFPAYRDNSQDAKNRWCKLLKELIHHKH